MSFSDFIEKHRNAGQLVFQGRMGTATPAKMRSYLEKIKALPFPTVGTITIDSYTRVNDLKAIPPILMKNEPLNGYPICTYSNKVNAQLLKNLCDPQFYVQVRHGSAKPQHIFRSSINNGLYIGEGGPISYCLPYSRLPIKDSVKAWKESCLILTSTEQRQRLGHMESFGGCLLGQLCHPSILVAVSLLECMFFKQNGIRSVSTSYAQGYNSEQDTGALLALRQLALEYLDDIHHHIVLYTFMGMFPKSLSGAQALIRESIKLAKTAKVERIILKTVAEAHKIPEIEDNLNAFMLASSTFQHTELVPRSSRAIEFKEQIYHEAKLILETVLSISPDIGEGLVQAFQFGLLDIPFCIHADNKNKSRVTLGEQGEIEWADVGDMKYLKGHCVRNTKINSYELIQMLGFNQYRYDSLLE